MTVTVDSNIDKTKANEAEVRLYKPLSSLTAFRIIETPLRQPLRNHDLCKIQGAGWTFLELSTKQQKAFIKAQTATECAHEQAKPPVRPVEAIRGVKLEPGAFLLQSATTASLRWLAGTGGHRGGYSGRHEGKRSGPGGPLRSFHLSIEGRRCQARSIDLR
jgi:hypothetical protein